MATIDLIVLGMLKKEPLSAYEIQKLVEYRRISQWVKISTPSIYKKVIQLEEKGLISGIPVKEGKMPEKSVYSLTESGQREFERLMLEIASRPIQLYLDVNAVIVNLAGLSPEHQDRCLADIGSNVAILKARLEDNIRSKEGVADIPEMGMAVLNQQYILAEALEEWIDSMKRSR